MREDLRGFRGLLLDIERIFMDIGGIFYYLDYLLK